MQWGSYVKKVGDGNLDLFNSVGFKNWDYKPQKGRPNAYWCIDRERSLYFVSSGSFRYEDDEFYDLSYMSKIVRIIIFSTVNPEECKITFLIKKITIPRSIWLEQDDIILALKDAIYAYGNVDGKHAIEIKIECEPELVETDYNGR